INLRQALNHFEEFTVSQVVYYQQLAHYYTTHKFCGICGRLTQRGRKNKFVMCHSCNTEIYPHIAPSVIVRIHKDDSILMARGVNFPVGVWGLIAGFVEIGESLEQAVKREVKEEVGIEVTNIRYWGSQPWPFPNNSLMMGFTADYVSGTITPQVEEIGAAGFYSRDNLPGMPSISYSIASKMITDYLQQTA
ncbi:MAG: NAD(+) diphosphatase, partial [Burkholderiales bacterium]